MALASLAAAALAAGAVSTTTATAAEPRQNGKGSIKAQEKKDKLGSHDRELLAKAAPLVQERMQMLGDAPGLLGFLFRDVEAYDEDAVKGLPANTAEVLAASIDALQAVPEDAFTAEAIQAALAASLIDGLGLKPRVAYGPARVALSGRRVSPPLFESMELLGKSVTLDRLERLRAERS